MGALHFVALALGAVPMAEGDGYSATDFGASLLTAANGALLYVGAGVAAGIVIFAVTFGIPKGLAALRTVGK